MSVARDSDAGSSTASLGGLSDQRKQSSTSLASRYASPTPHALERFRHPSSSTLSLIPHGNAAGSAYDAHPPPQSAWSRTRGGTELHASGIDEEQDGEERKQTTHVVGSLASDRDNGRQTAGSTKERRRRLVRPLTRDKDRGRSVQDDTGGSLPTQFGSHSFSHAVDGASSRRKGLLNGGADRARSTGNSGLAPTEDVEMTLDTNFDQIDDIVDTSVRQASLMPVGPKDEPLQEGGWSLEGDALANGGNGGSASATTPKAEHIGQFAGGSARPQFASYPSETDAPWIQAPAMGRNASLQSQTLQRDPSQQSHMSKSGLRKVSLAEAQRLTSSMPNGGLFSNPAFRSRAGSAAGRLDAGLGPTSPMSEYDEYPFVASADATPAQNIFKNVTEQRKDSAASKMSARSGVSPKTSAIDLTQYGHEGEDSARSRHTFMDQNYHFSPVPDIPIDLSFRKSSTGSAGTAAAAALASTWMAPDSWAVQPDNDRDYLRDEDDDGSQGESDQDGHSNAEHSQQTMLATSGKSLATSEPSRKMSAVSAVTDSERSLSTSGVLAGGEPATSPKGADNALFIPRGSQVSASSALSSEGGSTGSGPSHRASTTVASPTDKAASAHRGGALGVAGGAAAAAANMLGFRGKQRQGTPLSRPSTAKEPNGMLVHNGIIANGSFASRPTTGDESSVSQPTVISEAGFNALTSKAHLSKRGVLTHQSSQYGGISGKSYILRVDTPFGVRTVSIPLYTNTSSLRAIIGRKSPADARSYRLFVRDKGSERPLGEQEKPALLQRRRMEQAGYSEYDSLETLGREDHSYLLRFVYRPDLVPTFDSEQFGSTEDNYTHLDLQSRNLEMVPIFLYRHADWINSLDLSGNPMSDLPTDFVQLCTSLRTLRLSNLALKRIPQSIKHSETLTHLDLSNNRIPDLNNISLEEIVQLKSLKLQNNRLTELPASLAELINLKQLNISNNRFDSFPPVICDFRALTDLDISFNAIGVLPANLRQLRQLESLILVGNSIEQLPSCIEELVSLRKIDVRRNALQDVSQLFRIESLSEALCEHNSVKSFSATLGPNLRSINLGQNPLSRLAVRALGTISQLVCLNLSSANLSKLDEGLLTQLPSLYDLILDGNQFVVLPETIGELTELRLLSCTNNHLATLPDSIGKLSKLKRLLVHNNNLSSLPKSLWSCQSLSSINASSNLLEGLPLPELVETLARGGDVRPGTASSLILVENGRKGSGASALAGMLPATPTSTMTSGKTSAPPLALALKKLRLADNRLTDDVFGVIALLSEVEILNLSFNDIYEVPNASLSKMSQLRELYLSGNDMSSLPTDDLVQLQHLRILHINANRLQTLPAELGQIRTLANLDVGNNSLKYNIANWHYDWNWNSNPELRYLNLSGNKRLEIKSKMSSITGAGRRTDTSDFQRLVSLRVLGLMDVTVTLQQMPDENENRRVRTSLSQVNNMSYGISDALGRFDDLSLVDVVVPNFRQESNECLIGLFEGRGHGARQGSRVAKFLADWARHRVEREVAEALAGAAVIAAGSGGSKTSLKHPDETQMPHIMRRAFLRLQQEYAILLMTEGARSAGEGVDGPSADEIRLAGPTMIARTNKNQWQAGASGVLVYIVDRTIHVANAGDALAVLSRGGSAFHLTTRHDPFDREETQRIRSAEGWVSLRGYVNDLLDVSRSFGYYHLAPFVNAAPAVHSIHLNDSDEFVIIASRALWDHMSYQTAVDIARTERNDLMIAAQKLRDFAISYGAEESLMVMIISVGDIFDSRRQSRVLASSRFDPTVEALKKMHRRDRDELPSDRTLARLEREVAPPIGHVALVFTDIKNSTSLWETNGGMQSAMRLHNVLLRRQLRTVGGYEVKTEGDAFMVSFPSVTSALIWCFNVQVQLLREDWPQEILESEDGKEILDSDGQVIYRGLSVRMGIHWGWPVCENDPVTRRMDYFGPMVNRAARISGAADGGQIMASRDVVNELTSLLGTFDEAGGATGLFSEQAGNMFNGEDADLDEEAFRLLHPNVTRDVVLLRRMGFGISEVGERKLKGLETPEMLNLVYPKQLAGRMATREDAPVPKVFEPTPSLLNIDEIKALGNICLRLESVSNAQLFPGVLTDESASTFLGEPQQSLSLDAASSNTAAQRLIQPASSRTRAMENFLTLKPELLIVSIRDDAPDDELANLLEQLVVRIRNAMTTIALRQCLLPTGSTPVSQTASLEALAHLLGPLQDFL